MGKRDSSKTRVQPVFDQLYKSDSTGQTWLPTLISLPIGGSEIRLPPHFDFGIQERAWGKYEKKLEPPASLLSWLIRHPRPPVFGGLSKDPAKARKRLEWIQGSDIRISEALHLLRDNPSGEDWHLFEGFTQPDVFVQTPDLILVVEGKRTERKPTTSTKWMAVRHQMLRHIDCALEIAGDREVVGFFIVEGNADTGEVPAAWIDYARQTRAPEAVASSLPHRSPEVQKGISSSFVGVTTWQRVCREFDLDWTNLPDGV